MSKNKLNKSQQVINLIEGNNSSGSLDREIYDSIFNQLKDKSGGAVMDLWKTVKIVKDDKEITVEAMIPNRGNMMFRIPRKPEVDENNSFYAIYYKLYKFNNKRVLQDWISTKERYDTKQDFLKALEPFKKS